jgi:ArsR family transcriptional regulator
MSRKPARLKLSDEAFELVAARFRALSEASRLKLIAALEAGERNVTELVEATGLAQANVSRHLQALITEGILVRRKEGLAVYYAIADPAIVDLCENVCGGVQKRLAQHAKAFGD